MFQINDGYTINITRGDIAIFSVNAIDDSGANHVFKKGDVLRFKVTEKKACDNVMLQKDFGVEEETEQVEIFLTEEDTKIGEVISKPTDYWYEVELNPSTNPQTIIGYDEEGAKIFKLYPEGNDVESVEPTPEEIPVVDAELDLTSERPVQNNAIARAMISIQEELARIENTKNITSDDIKLLETNIETNKSNITTNTNNIETNTNDIETLKIHATNTSNPHNVTAEQTYFDKNISGLNSNNVQGAIDEVSEYVGLHKTNYLPYPYHSLTIAPNGVTWSDNKGIVTANGKATSDSYVQCARYSCTLEAGTYKIKGCPKNGSNSTYWLVGYYINSKTSGTVYLFEYGEGVEFTIDERVDLSLDLVVKSGYTANNLVFKPMVYDASIDIEDDTYEPYVPSVNEVQEITIRTGVKLLVQGKVATLYFDTVNLANEELVIENVKYRPKIATANILRGVNGGKYYNLMSTLRPDGKLASSYLTSNGVSTSNKLDTATLYGNITYFING